MLILLTVFSTFTWMPLELNMQTNDKWKSCLFTMFDNPVSLFPVSPLSECNYAAVIVVIVELMHDYFMF